MVFSPRGAKFPAQSLPARGLQAIVVIGIAAITANLMVVQALAEPPARLSTEVAERMIIEGDQLVDRSEYLKAVELYTDAYMGIVTQIRGQEFAMDIAPNLMTRTE